MTRSYSSTARFLLMLAKRQRITIRPPDSRGAFLSTGWSEQIIRFTDLADWI